MSADAPNPYAPSTAVASEPPASPRRWLLVLGTILNFHFLIGAALLVFGKRRRALFWAAWGLVYVVVNTLAVWLASTILYALSFALFAVLIIGVLIEVFRARHAEIAWPLRRALISLGCLLVVAVGAGFLRQALFVEAFNIPNGSMMPTLLPGDHLVVWKTTFVKRGEVIVFRYPPSPDTKYVKRAVGLGGDTVEIRNGTLLVNGQPEREHQLIASSGKSPSNFGPVQVPPGEVFMVGDNRDNSADSRMWGAVPNELIIGKASLITWGLGGRFIQPIH